MDEDTPKSVNISKFFGAPDSSMVAAASDQPMMSKPPILSGGLDLSNILNIIKTQIDEKQDVEDLKTDTENVRLQSLVDSLTGRVEKLTSELAGLFSLIIGDAEKRDKEKKLELKQAIQEQGEISKAVKLEALQKTTGDIAQVSQQASDEVVGKIESDRQMGLLGVALGLGGGLLSQANEMKDSGEPGYRDFDKPVPGQVDPVEVKKYLMEHHGLSEEHAVGMLNNIEAESSFQPGAYVIDSNGKPSGGLFQHNGGRYEAMVNYVGENWQKDWKGQIDYAMTESDTRSYIETQFETPEDASRWFTKNWERPAEAEAKAESRLEGIQNFVNLDISNASTAEPPEGQTQSQGQVQPRTVASLPPTRDPSGLMRQTEPSGSTIAVLPTSTTSAPAPASSINDAGADASNPIFPATNRLDPYPEAVALSINVVSA